MHWGPGSPLQRWAIWKIIEHKHYQIHIPWCLPFIAVIINRQIASPQECGSNSWSLAHHINKTEQDDRGHWIAFLSLMSSIKYNSRPYDHILWQCCGCRSVLLLLHIPTELATNFNRRIVASLVIQSEFASFSKAILFLCHEKVIQEEWPTFHQYSHLMVRPSNTISILAQRSFPQTLIGESSPPWSSTSRSPLFSHESSFFLLLKMLWKNGRHSTNTHI